MTKVLFITHNYIRHKGDFAGVFLHLLATKLANKGIEVSVVAPHDAGLPTEETIDGIKIYRFRYADDESETFAYRGDMHNQLFSNPFKIFLLKKFLDEEYKLACKVIDNEQIDIVSLHWLIPNGYVAKKLISKYKKRLRLFISSHGSDIRILSKFKFVYNYLKKSVRRAAKYTVVSSYLKNQLLALDSEIGEKIEIMPLPNDESIFYPDDRITKDKNLIVAVTRLTTQKRIDYLLKAMKVVTEKIPHARLDIYGDGPEKEAINTLIDKLGLESNVTIYPPVPQKDLRPVYNKASVVVLNSFNEGFGLALTEAMLSETAVIGTDSGGIPDIIDNNKTGLLVQLDNEKALADAIIQILTDGDLRNRLANDGYKKAIARFSSDSSAKAYASLFKG